jgi:phospholipid/cholesterol/gamma-HCH transport system substrate-binding protein
MSRQTVNTLVGALVVAIGAAAFLLSQRGGQADIPDSYELKASFGSIDGVSKGTKVLLTGLPVGQVDRFTYNEERQRAILVMSIRDGIGIPLDSVVLIVTDGLLGAKYLKIQAGGDSEMMKPGGQFDYTQDSIVFEEILQKVILNAEQTRRKQQEEKDKNKDDKTPGKKPNEASLSGGATRLADSEFPNAWVK